MNQKSIIAVLGVVVVILIGTTIYFATINNASQPVVPATKVAQQPVQPATPAVQQPDQSVASIKSGYKNLNVSDGTTSFSFAVPEKWLTETRHSGEKQLVTGEMRNFLATNFEGDIKANSKLYSDYYDISWSEFKKMSEAEVKKAYFRSDDLSNPFPNASVAAGDHIWYTDTSWQQVDFYLKNETAINVIAKIKQEQNSYCNKYGNDIVGCGNDAPKWSKITIDNKNVDILTYSTDKDEKGNELISKGGTGGKNFYVELPNLNKTLVISKQAKGDVQFEKDFEYLIQTLKFTK